jgi:hypothetical protein
MSKSVFAQRTVVLRVWALLVPSWARWRREDEPDLDLWILIDPNPLSVLGKGFLSPSGLCLVVVGIPSPILLRGSDLSILLFGNSRSVVWGCLGSQRKKKQIGWRDGMG